MLAVSLSTAGFVRLVGPGGMAVGGLLFFLIGNPGSGNASAPQLLPGFWRAVSQWLPPGAGGTTLRNVAYFDGNATLRPLLVLTSYASSAPRSCWPATRSAGFASHGYAAAPASSMWASSARDVIPSFMKTLRRW